MHALSLGVSFCLKERHLLVEINKRGSRIRAALHILFVAVLMLRVILVIVSILSMVDAGRPSMSLLQGPTLASGIRDRPAGRVVNRIGGGWWRVALHCIEKLWPLSTLVSLSRL
jgi:hypothetical protein